MEAAGTWREALRAVERRLGDRAGTLRMRVEGLKGEFSLKSIPGRGTSIMARIPLA